MKADRIKFGVTPGLLIQPLIFGLVQAGPASSYQLYHQSGEENLRGLLDGSLDLALVDPLSYAGSSTRLQIVADFAVVSRGRSAAALLFFTEELRNLRTIGHFDDPRHYRVLTDLLFREYWDIEAEWHGLENGSALDDALTKYDACLLAGDRAISNSLFSVHQIDILDDWFDKTALGYTHQMVVALKDQLSSLDLGPLAASLSQGQNQLKKIAADFSETHSVKADDVLNLLQECYRYVPEETDWSDLSEYFRFLYYYSIIDYLPELRV